MAFKNLTRSEEQAGFVTLATYGIRESDWRRMANRREVAEAVAKAFFSYVPYAVDDPDIQKLLAEADASQGLPLMSIYLLSSTSEDLKSIIDNKIKPKICTPADILACFIRGKLSRDGYTTLFVLDDRMLRIFWNESRGLWEIVKHLRYDFNNSPRIVRVANPSQETGLHIFPM